MLQEFSEQNIDFETKSDHLIEAWSLFAYNIYYDTITTMHGIVLRQYRPLG
jgi:hypothetical protein